MNSVLTFLKENKLSIISFLSIGILSSILYLLVFNLLLHIFGMHYQVALSIAYVSSVVFYFIINRRYTFRSHGHTLYRQLIRFMGLLVINYFITLLIVRYVVEMLFLSPSFGIVLSIGATFVTNYFMGKFWVFRNPIAQIPDHT